METDGYIGARVRRVEDSRLVRGAGRYVGDIVLPGMLHAGFVRSPHAHARTLSLDLSAARELPGVVAAYAGGDLPELAEPTPIMHWPHELRGHGFIPLAHHRVRFAGEPVAVVLADDPSVLEDAIETVAVDYEPLPAVTDVERATEQAPIWEDAPDNRAVCLSMGFGDVQGIFETAEVVVEERFAFARAAGAAMEPRAVLAVPGEEAGIRVTLWDSTQAPHNVRDRVSTYLGLQPDEVRVVAPDVGGGFGVKGRVYQEEYVLPALALRLGRPVRWVATRTEDFLTTSHGRAQVHFARLAARADAAILAIDDRILQDSGAYTPFGAGVAMNTSRHIMGPYRMQAARVQIETIFTNKVITGPLRGGGRPQGIYVMERLLDRLARRLDLDPAEIRRRNFIPPHSFPYDTGFHGRHGSVIYDSGNFPEYLNRALEVINYEGVRRQQAEARRQGQYLGVGLAAFIESTGTGSEGARVEVAENGAVRVAVGSPSQGQGHATSFAQVAAQRLGVPVERVQVVSGDTKVLQSGTGTFASRMAVYGGNAVAKVAGSVRRKALQIAADMLEIAPEDLEIAGGWVSVKGYPDRGVDLVEVAHVAASRGEALRADEEFEPEHASMWAGGVNVALVEVDVETGKVTILRYVVVHDAGTLINPTIVEGQIHGGVAHGIGNVLYEGMSYADEAQPASVTFADYPMPGAGDVPPIEIVHCETPSPFNVEGIKGAGEGGTIAGIPTLVSAVEDALAPFGVTLSDVPIRPEDVVRALERFSHSSSRV